jgi:hypothetical protein
MVRRSGHGRDAVTDTAPRANGRNVKVTCRFYLDPQFVNKMSTGIPSSSTKKVRVVPTIPR